MCSAPLLKSENNFFCATTPQGARAFRAAVNSQTAALKPIGSWAALTGENAQQRSFVYRDGFMTLSYFPSSDTPKQNLFVVQYIIPND